MVDTVTRLPNNGNGIPVHQALHGYSDGHRLLESSLEIPDTLSRLLLRLSDLSGGSVSGGFDEYITGYPLIPLHAYALAKTWYAPEMPRPGCVWTHTLIISRAVLAQITSLDTLLALFRRPGTEFPRNAYSKALHFENSEHRQRSKTLKPDTLQGLIAAHYRNSSSAVILPAHKSEEFEKEIFAVWSQKWPSLRFDFTFCTGSLSSRTFEKRPFEIQCVPVSKVREVSLDIVEAGVASTIVASPIQSPMPTWVVEAAIDAAAFGGGSLREFLWQSTDDKSSQCDFELLVSAYFDLTRLEGLAQSIEYVSKLFPEPHSGEKLKQIMFGGSRHPELFIRYEEQELLTALATTSEFASFDSQTLELQRRAHEFGNSYPYAANELIRKLFNSTLNPLGEEILSGLISDIGPQMDKQISSELLQYLPTLFRANPSLGTSPHLWIAGADRKWELFEALAAHETLSAEVLGGIISALLESGSDYLAGRAVDRWGKDAVFQVLDWINDHNGWMSDTCRDALRRHVPSVMAWVESPMYKSSAALMSAAYVVAPQTLKISRRSSSRIWLQLSHDFKNQSKETDEIYLSAFLLALALCNAPPTPFDLIEESFDMIHEAARNNRLNDSSWMVIQPFVPELSWLSNWDKCERLRRGLVAAALRHFWPPTELLLRINDPYVREQIVRSASRVEGGGEYFRVTKPAEQ
jgi:hypothetical protein